MVPIYVPVLFSYYPLCLLGRVHMSEGTMALTGDQPARGLLSKINANLNYTPGCGPAVCSVLLVGCSGTLSIAPSIMLDPSSVPVPALPGLLASATFLQMGKECQEPTVRPGPARKGGRGEGGWPNAGAVRLLTEMILHPAIGIRAVFRRG